MYAVKAIYDGVNFKPKQPISVRGRYEVMITFLEPVLEDFADAAQKHPREGIIGLLKGKVWMAAY